MIAEQQPVAGRLLNEQADHGPYHIKSATQLHDKLGEQVRIYFRENGKLRSFVTDFMGCDYRDGLVRLEGWEPLHYAELGLETYPGGTWEPDQRLEFMP